jgi:hypothetical protein
MAASYRSYAEQGGHYFDRPHEALPPGPIRGPAAWRGAALDPRAWHIRLDATQLAGFERALAAARATGKPLAALGREDFPLGPSLAADVARWRDELVAGRGFLLLSGFPVERWGEADASRFFWCLGLALGWPGAQNPQGDLLGHVVDTGDDRTNPLVRLTATTSVPRRATPTRRASRARSRRCSTSTRRSRTSPRSGSTWRSRPATCSSSRTTP